MDTIIAFIVRPDVQIFIISILCVAFLPVISTYIQRLWPGTSIRGAEFGPPIEIKSETDKVDDSVRQTIKARKRPVEDEKLGSSPVEKAGKTTIIPGIKPGYRLERNVNLTMRVILTVAVGGAALYIIIKGTHSGDTHEWAYVTIGTIIGNWLPKQ